jgi:hypothetical protein
MFRDDTRSEHCSYVSSHILWHRNCSYFAGVHFHPSLVSVCSSDSYCFHGQCSPPAGNPWVLLTASAATLLYRQALQATKMPPTGEVAQSLGMGSSWVLRRRNDNPKKWDFAIRNVDLWGFSYQKYSKIVIYRDLWWFNHQKLEFMGITWWCK